MPANGSVPEPPAPMKVLHVLDHSLPLQSGYVFRTLGILRAQREMGWQTFHLTSPKQGQHSPNGDGNSSTMEEVDGWEFFRTAQGHGRFGRALGQGHMSSMMATYRRLLEVIDEVQPDVIHAHSPVLNGLPALWAGKRTKIPVVYEIRAFWEDGAVNIGTTQAGSLRYRMSRGMESRAVRQASAVFTICDGLKGDLIQRGVPAEKVTLIPNAVDIEAFPLLTEVDSALREELGLLDCRVLGFVGSFYAYEGLDLLIEALPQMLEDDPKTKVLLVGGGPRKEALEKQVERMGLQDHVVFTGRVPHAEVRRYYSLIDLLVFPRRSIRLTELVTPLKPLESMAQGIVCIASDVGGHRELIRDGETGYLFAADDPKALADCVQRSFAKRSAWQGIRDAGREYVESQRNWKVSVAGYRPVYERLVGRS